MSEHVFEGGECSREELLSYFAEEQHVSHLLMNVAINVTKFVDAAQVFEHLEQYADSIKPEPYADIADGLDSYAGLIMAISDRIREVARLPKKNEAVR